ncbi:Rho GTPase activation protein [Marasmius fiardii PR-910]|nr:Rho GTPase activation protein [Marasmius fiardii PR-910]
MADPWDDVGVHYGGPTEFLVSAELFVSTAAGTALRKPPHSKRRTERRDGSTDEKRIREKTSWLSLNKDSAGGGHWRPATCKLSEEGERCLLNIYVDESILYQTLSIHLLNHTDIRHAHSSLFHRKNCIAIYCIAGKRWSSTSTSEPVYLQFPSVDVCNTWVALLRSYALPEIYGRWFFPEEGGSYRMWRQVELNVLQGRNLGNTKPFDVASNEDSDSPSEPDPVDMDVHCEVKLNDVICGRTTTKKGVGSPDWHENFTFGDLPPFDNLEVVVWREKKLFKSSPLGTIRIALSNFPRGEAVEGWFPVLHSGSATGDLQVGELRLKLRVDEELILPFATYERLLRKLRSRNFLDWLTDFESKLKLKTVASQLMSMAVADSKLIEQVQILADREVDGSVSSAHQTLFRGNNALTRIAEQTMAWYGMEFLESSIGSVLRRLVAEKVSIEVDPLRSGKSQKDVERNVELLISWCKKIWGQIFASRQACPPEMRRLFCTIRELVEKRYPLQDNRELPWKCVSAFVFLRFIVPAILHPHLFGLCPGLPSERVQRSLTLIAKVIQSLANLNATGQKEEFMVGVKDFLKESLPAMIDYLLVVSTPVPEDTRNGGARTSDHTKIIISLQKRMSTMPVLYREAIPMLPHLLDPARHLAVITSAVIRTSRNYLADVSIQESHDRPLEELCSRCIEVEEKALHRVSQLAAQLSANQRKVSKGNESESTFAFSPPSPTTPHSPRSTRSERPSTAPSVSDADNTRRRMLFDTSSSNTGPFIKTSEARPPPRNKLLHLKSTSTDSISALPRSPSMPVDTRQEIPIDVSDDPVKRKKKFGLFRR